jgi:hypothetical protein
MKPPLYFQRLVGSKGEPAAAAKRLAPRKPLMRPSPASFEVIDLEEPAPRARQAGGAAAGSPAARPAAWSSVAQRSTEVAPGIPSPGVRPRAPIFDAASASGATTIVPPAPRFGAVTTPTAGADDGTNRPTPQGARDRLEPMLPQRGANRATFERSLDALRAAASNRKPEPPEVEAGDPAAPQPRLVPGPSPGSFGDGRPIKAAASSDRGRAGDRDPAQASRPPAASARAARDLDESDVGLEAAARAMASRAAADREPPRTGSGPALAAPPLRAATPPPPPPLRERASISIGTLEVRVTPPPAPSPPPAPAARPPAARGAPPTAGVSRPPPVFGLGQI